MLKILHVDNSSFFRHMLKDIVTTKGLSCVTAQDIPAAFECLRKHEIDLIITAIELKGGGGEYFIEKLNSSKFNEIPTIVITSNDSIEERKKMFSRGVIDYIPKDSSFGEKLLSFVDKLTEEDVVKDKLKEMRIAVLDDSKMGLGIIKNILNLNGIKNIDLYQDPEHLLRATKKYDVYFLDLVLPKISGEQVIIELRKKSKESVLIAISAIDNYKVISNILHSGADDYILKPFNASIFMARLAANARTFLLIEEIEKKNLELKTIASIDGLTKLYNHNYIFEKLEKKIAEANKYQEQLSIAMFYVDDFNSINDTFGHQVGDKVVISAAKIITNSLSKLDILGRYGGVIFLAIFPETDGDEAYDVAEKIRKNIMKIKIKDRRITVSAGVVELENENAMQLINKADKLVYKAKERGKNRVEQ
ncbi:MAG: diguanylate cyclase [bacterium]|nr:diguanylate cyclase [bacterium]